MDRTSSLLRLVILGLALFLGNIASAADFQLDNGAGGYRLKTNTFVDQRFRDVIRQRYDFSCGSAALATLLTYHYNRSVQEKPVLERMYESGDKAKIRKEGFSLLDMKRYLASHGLKADGFRDSLDKLIRVGIPAIVLINNKGYLHFVVVKGVRKNEVLVSDPSHGTRIMARKDFEKIWNGILFVILDEMQVARGHFNLASQWHVRGAGGVTIPSTFSENMGVYTLHIADKPAFY